MKTEIFQLNNDTMFSYHTNFECILIFIVIKCEKNLIWSFSLVICQQVLDLHIEPPF